MPQSVLLRDHFATYISHTSDLGVEVGIPDFSLDGGPASLLNPWIDRDEAGKDKVPADLDVHAAELLTCDLEGPEMVDDSESAQGGEPEQDDDASFLYPNAMPISSCCCGSSRHPPPQPSILAF